MKNSPAETPTYKIIASSLSEFKDISEKIDTLSESFINCIESAEKGLDIIRIQMKVFPEKPFFFLPIGSQSIELTKTKLTYHFDNFYITYPREGIDDFQISLGEFKKRIL